jgi:hypothetical protein
MITSKRQNGEKIYANQSLPTHEYEEFKEHCDHINMKYGLQVENLMKDFNLIMLSKKGREIMLKINDTWGQVKELEGELDERDGLPHRVERVQANHYVDTRIYQEFKEHCDQISIGYSLQIENLIRDFNQIMWRKSNDEAIQKARSMWSRVQELESELKEGFECTHPPAKL